jgi:hypothetical protein
MTSFEKKIAAAILSKIRARGEEHSSQIGDVCDNSARAVAPARLREARFSDFPAVAELKRRWGLGADSVENWERLWRDNPALAQVPRRPIGWVLEARDGIVGYIGNISLRCRYGDKTLSAVTAQGLVVEPSYRGVGVSLNAAFFRQQAVDLYVCTTTVPAVGKISRALKSDPLPQSDYWTVFFWVLRPSPFARTVMKRLAINSSLSKMGGVVGSLAIAADTKVYGRRPKRSSVGLQVTDISIGEIGDEFDEIWLDKVNEKTQLLTDRSAATLRWHYEIPGDRGNTRVLRCSRNGRLLGYAMVRNEQPDENGLRKSIVADLLAIKDEPAVVEALLASAYNQGIRAGSHILEVMGFPESIRRVFAQSKPYQRQYPACPYYYKAADPVFHKALSDIAAWYACPYDGDATLIRPSYSNSLQPGTTGLGAEDNQPAIPDHVVERERTETF